MTRSERRRSSWWAIALLLFFSSTGAWAVKEIDITYTTDSDGCVTDIMAEDTKYKQLNQKMSWQLVHDSGAPPQPGAWSIVQKSPATFMFCGADTLGFDEDGEAVCRSRDGNMPEFVYGVQWVPDNPGACAPEELDPAIIFDEGDEPAILDSLTFYRVLTVILLVALVVCIRKLRARAA